MVGRRAVPILLAALAAGLLAGCGGSDDGGAATAGGKATAVKAPPALASSGRLRICTDPTYPPAGFMQGNRYVGFDMDIATELAASMGVETHYVQTGFDGIVAAVQAGKCDALMAAMNITPERERQIAFVRYGKTGQSLMVNKGDGDRFSSLEDLAGHRVGVQVGTTQKRNLDALSARLKAAGRSGVDVVTFPKDSDAVAALQTGRVDAYFADTPPIGWYLKRNPGRFEVAVANLTATPIGIGVDKDDQALQAALTDGIDRLYASGRMAEILEEWNVADIALDDAERGGAK